MIVAVVTVIGYASYSKSLSSTYTDTNHNFSITYPKGWTAKPLDGFGDVYASIEEVSNPKNSINILYNDSLSSTGMGATLKEVVSSKLTDIQPVSVNGIPGYKGTFTNDVINYHGTQYWFESNGHIYRITFEKTLEGNPDVTKIIESFVITK
jgi:hypothetical protein